MMKMVSKFTLLLLMTAVLADQCTEQECDKTEVIPAVGNQINLQPCDVCTECPASEPETVQAWWYYEWPNGSQTHDISATVQGRGYVINLLGHPSLVTPMGSHTLYVNYMYLCDGIPGVLYDIEITLTPVDAIIECPNEMPVSEGSSVDIWCETGLPDSRVVHTTFTFEGRQGICGSSYVQVDHSSWRVIHNESEPYTCGLHIDDIQPSDSGEYYCEVNLPGTLDTVRSSICIVQVEGASNPDVILETVIPSVGGLLILVVPALLITVACVVIRRHRHPDDPVLRWEDDHLISQNPLAGVDEAEVDEAEVGEAAAEAAGVYYTSGSTAAVNIHNGRLEESRHTNLTSSQPNDLADVLDPNADIESSVAVV